MAKIGGVVEEVLNSQNLTLYGNPFGSGNVVRQLTYDKGEYPEHLRQYAIGKGECANRTGKVTYEGKKIPATAACVAAKQSGSGSGRFMGGRAEE